MLSLSLLWTMIRTGWFPKTPKRDVEEWFQTYGKTVEQFWDEIGISEKVKVRLRRQIEF